MAAICHAPKLVVLRLPSSIASLGVVTKVKKTADAPLFHQKVAFQSNRPSPMILQPFRPLDLVASHVINAGRAPRVFNALPYGCKELLRFALRHWSESDDNLRCRHKIAFFLAAVAHHFTWRAGMMFAKINPSIESSVTQTARPTFTKSRFFRFKNQSRRVAVFTPNRSAALFNRIAFCISNPLEAR
jgi:hypothetical protein